MRGALAGLGLVVALATAGTLPACGRKTPVQPPEAVAPAIIDGLSAANGVGGVNLSWKRPTETADGDFLFDLDAFIVERAVAGGPFVFLVRVPVVDRNKLRQQKRFRYVDPAVEIGESYRYRVLSITFDGYLSPPSHEAEIVRAVPTMTPTPATTATATPTVESQLRDQ